MFFFYNFQIEYIVGLSPPVSRLVRYAQRESSFCDWKLDNNNIGFYSFCVCLYIKKICENDDGIPERKRWKKDGNLTEARWWVKSFFFFYFVQLRNYVTHHHYIVVKDIEKKLLWYLKCDKIWSIHVWWCCFL